MQSHVTCRLLKFLRFLDLNSCTDVEHFRLLLLVRRSTLKQQHQSINRLDYIMAAFNYPGYLSLLEQESSTKELIYKIRDLNRKFRLACSQLILINNLIDETEIRYNRSQAKNRRSYRYVLRLKLCTLEGTRNMFYEYAYAKADELEKMQLELYNKTGLAWNDQVARETDDEDEGSDDEIEDLEDTSVSDLGTDNSMQTDDSQYLIE